MTSNDNLELQLKMNIYQGNVMDKELILDTDVYQSDHRIPSLGKGTLEDDTLPVKYSDGQWENIRKQLDFPASELDGNQYINTSHTGIYVRGLMESRG